METDTPFFILGLPRTRTAWLSVVATMCGRTCFHEGMRGFDSFDAYTQGRAAPGDADPTLIYWTARLIAQWPEARFVVVSRDPDEALADFLAASPPEMGEAMKAGWTVCLQAFTTARDLLRGNPNALFVDYPQLTDCDVVADIIKHCGCERPAIEAVERWQLLRITSNITAPGTFVSPPLEAQPLPRMLAGNVCDVTGLEAEFYTLEQFSLVSGWWHYHTGLPLTESALPPLGVVVRLDGEPVAACWCYECYGVPVAELTFPCTRPSLSVKDSRRALLYAVSCLISAAGKGHEPEASFRIFKTLAPAGLNRFLSKIGFRPMLTERQPMILTL